MIKAQKVDIGGGSIKSLDKWGRDEFKNHHCDYPHQYKFHIMTSDGVYRLDTPDELYGANMTFECLEDTKLIGLIIEDCELVVGYNRYNWLYKPDHPDTLQAGDTYFFYHGKDTTFLCSSQMFDGCTIQESMDMVTQLGSVDLISLSAAKDRIIYVSFYRYGHVYNCEFSYNTKHGPVFFAIRKDGELFNYYKGNLIPLPEDT